MSSQNLRPARAGLRLFCTAALAASTISGDIPESGTGTAIHLGYECEDEQGEHVEVIERVTCRRCHPESF